MDGDNEYNVLYCTVLYCTVLYCTVLYLTYTLYWRISPLGWAGASQATTAPCSLSTTALMLRGGPGTATRGV